MSLDIQGPIGTPRVVEKEPHGNVTELRFGGLSWPGLLWGLVQRSLREPDLINRRQNSQANT